MLGEEDDGPSGDPAAVPAALTPETGGGMPRGARFAGASEGAEQEQKQKQGPERPEPIDDGGGQAVADIVRRLVGLRKEGRSGEAYALLVEVADWPPERFPHVATEFQRAGLGADWATLLWEAGALPPDRLVAAADALEAAGWAEDGRQILRQGVARPAPEIGEAVLALDAEGRHREVATLLDVYVRVRTPEESVRSVEADPQRLGPLLLDAARGVSEDRYWDFVHALRVAGLAP
jgi:hypothetical protein